MSRPKKVKKIVLPQKRGRKPKILSAAQMLPKKKIETPETLKGFKDILPLDAPYWEFIRGRADKLADDYGFKKIETPILEPLVLFKRILGRYTDLVEKEMFEFALRDGEEVALRPEGTAGVARAFINHGMINLPQPVKLIYEGPMFRYENPQAGRLREHHQIGFEILGSSSPAADAELILIGANLMKELGISFSLELNSLGCPLCRPQFRQALLDYYKPLRKKICADCRRRLVKNPIRLLDCKQESCEALKLGAPQTVNFLDEGCKKHFMQVLEFLDELGIIYNLNSFLVRGLDYYTKTVWEFWPTSLIRAQTSLLNGGRYDNLIEDLGGENTPAAGFALGLERVIARLKEEGVVLPPSPRLDVFVAHLGHEPKIKTMVLYEELRKQDFSLAENFAKDSLKQQLLLANKLKAKFTLILGQKEMIDKTILLRDMDAGTQEIVDQNKLIEVLKRKLSNAEGEMKNRE